ncbi:uncharacterized protein LOC141629112 [Silene latifolia]|uniref:uncharacterized protein LOC141629112 n=1 Tax=Silene latifolia TaxID=37657 RepID=UPI003D76F4E6
MDELSSSRTMIHGFNLNGERAVGMIRVNLTMGDLSSDTLFHVMGGKTSFKLLLGRPWKHENGVFASTLHQCLKYYRSGERKIDGDAKPFSKVDSFFDDAKFFEENDTSSEFMPTTFSLTGKGGKRENYIIKEDAAASAAKENVVKKDVDKASKTATPAASPKKQETTQKTTPPALHYIPKSRHKDGESFFAECLTPKTEPKDKKSSLVFKQEWVAKVVTPLPSSSQTKIVRPPSNGFVCSSSQSSSEENKGIFDSNAYKLLAKAGYDFTNPTPIGKVIEAEPYGLNKAQHEVFKQDGSFMVTRGGLGYESPAPVKIGARRKGATASSQHITVEEVEENEEGEEKMHPSSVFDRISPPAEKCRPSIFTSALLTKEEEEEYYKLLVKYKDVYAWSYKEMSGLSPKIAVHRLAIKKGTSPKKATSTSFQAGAFRKKNGQLRICVDFRDLNDACPKENFPLPVTELMIDATTGHETLSFMDCTAGYNQIHMAPEDQEATEKICLALVFAIQKLRHYMQAHTIHVVSKADPIKYILSRPVLSGRLVKWAMLLKQYDLVFVPQKVVKGQAIADFFADHPVPAEWEISDDLLGEEIVYVDVLPPWQMYFDGAARQDGAGAGVVFVTPQNHLMPYAFTLTQLCTNNMAEYQALILGLQMAIEIGVRDMDIYEDSKLVINQILGEFEVKKEDLIPYHQQALQLLNQLYDIHVGHVPRSANKLADVLANLAATLALGAEESMKVPVCNRWVVSSLEGEENVDTTNMIYVYTVDEDD